MLTWDEFNKDESVPMTPVRAATPAQPPVLEPKPAETAAPDARSADLDIDTTDAIAAEEPRVAAPAPAAATAAAAATSGSAAELAIAAVAAIDPAEGAAELAGTAERVTVD